MLVLALDDCGHVEQRHEKNWHAYIFIHNLYIFPYLCILVDDAFPVKKIKVGIFRTQDSDFSLKNAILLVVLTNLILVLRPIPIGTLPSAWRDAISDSVW